MVALFVNTSGGNRQMAQANNVIENGRLAIELLEGDVVHAGYWGGYMPAFDDQTASGVPTTRRRRCRNPACASQPPGRRLIESTWSTYRCRSTTPTPFCNDRARMSPTSSAGTDVLVVRHAELCVAGSGGNCEADVAGKLYFQVSRCLTDLQWLRARVRDSEPHLPAVSERTARRSPTSASSSPASTTFVTTRSRRATESRR